MTYDEYPIEGIVRVSGKRQLTISNTRDPLTYPITGEHDNTLTGVLGEVLSSDRRTTIFSGTLTVVANSTGYYAAVFPATIVLAPGGVYWLHAIHTEFDIWKKVEAR